MTHDVVVIGAGSAGLTAAGGAAMFGLRVALIEQAAMGGECLNTGCVPSKALISAARRAHEARTPDRLGVRLAPPEVDPAGIHAHIRQAIAAIAPHDSQERFEALGVDVLRAPARFLDATTVQVGNERVSAPRMVIATGSRPVVPPIEGLDGLPFLTNETLFDLEILPRHLLILGGGAIGCEMAQAYRRLGAKVTIVEPKRPLAREDDAAAALVVERLVAEGVAIVGGAEVTRAEHAGEDIRLILDDGRHLVGSHLLVATGRQANVEQLDLDAAGIRHGRDGIEVDGRRRTTNRHIFAIGDCRAGPRFTHAAGYEGSLVVLQLATGLPSSVDWRALPRVTYTEPELAQIGLTEAEARQRFGKVEIDLEQFADNDRAVTEGATAGFLKVVRRGRKVIGVTIVGDGAGDLLLPWAQIITGKASSFALGSAIIPYPTRSEIAKAAAFASWQRTVFGKAPRAWARLLARLRR